MSRESNQQAPQGAFKDITPVKDDTKIEDLIPELNKLINAFNFLTKSLSLEKNFNGYITTVTIPATSEVAIQHFLGLKPKYRLVLKQEGNGIITDVPSGWNDKIITLYNNGAVEVTATILIARE